MGLTVKEIIESDLEEINVVKTLVLKHMDQHPGCRRSEFEQFVTEEYDFEDLCDWLYCFDGTWYVKNSRWYLTDYGEKLVKEIVRRENA